MEGGQIRQRTTLLDQLSVLPSPNLADLLKVRDTAAASRRETITLATVLASDSTTAESTNSTSSRGGGRTLLDIISDDEESRGGGGGWRALKERLRVRRDGGGGRPEATIRVSLMTLLELREREEEEDGNTEVGVMAVGEEESDEIAGGKAARTPRSQVCCVCMVREKGAAFIPCGHTFCRVCSRELWLGRGSCPLCNGAISEVLDIF